ncbi:MAG TPA: hypothetical protein VM099_05250 [Gemmatimonadaceae bacterium]|nr:hypothetical protein [Gemmatimonadaceae bacterium]
MSRVTRVDSEVALLNADPRRPANMKRILLLGLIVLTACDNKPADFKPRERMSQREKDSVLGASSLPGAPVVTRALGASDAGATQAAALDSASQEN